ncbi:hypothetical protein PF002_g29528 [Phytophthora fragariae]|uniref:Uncharacterized protein n=2 Tax=Phytophthora TaxID=4783 RepID=A0A6A3VSK4_9STRA|nr:hypothetical protein PF009_g29470 [Phytophthora fragariae]KAE9170423.1 hypothetical protein PF004_g27882 [Phytophthora fragariae]KAE9172592.1 hypothetical protein PF002_g29528 [Phytophthora fragariae]KAE9273766.1 hypothetical protein PR003_g29805 [Phytophthora rubi]
MHGKMVPFTPANTAPSTSCSLPAGVAKQYSARNGIDLSFCVTDA